MRAFAFAAVVVALIVPVGAPVQAKPRPGLFSVDPGRRSLRADPPASVGVTKVRNTTGRSLRVTVMAGLLTQDIAGGVSTDDRRPALDAAARILSVTPRRFVLAPGAARALTVRWRSTLPGKRSSYVGVSGLAVPVAKPGAGVSFNVRLIQRNELLRPGRLSTSGRFTGLRGEQAGRRKLRFFARVGNRGDVEARPESRRFVVRDTRGRVVASQRWEAPFDVLPGARVEYPIDLVKVLPAGRYRVSTTMRFGGKGPRRTITVALRLVGPNELPTARLALRGLTAAGDDDGPAEVKVTLVNTGSLARAARLKLKLFSSTRSDPLARLASATTRMLPGDRRQLSFRIGNVRKGTVYRVQVVAGDGERSLATAQANFIAGRPKASGRPKWITPAAIAAGALAVFGLGALAGARRRRP